MKTASRVHFYIVLLLQPGPMVATQLYQSLDAMLVGAEVRQHPALRAAVDKLIREGLVVKVGTIRRKLQYIEEGVYDLSPRLRVLLEKGVSVPKPSAKLYVTG